VSPNPAWTDQACHPIEATAGQKASCDLVADLVDESLADL
jgi:hypothetical protein